MQATDISQDVTLSTTGFSRRDFLTDKDTFKHKSSGATSSIQLSSDVPMGSLYLILDIPYGEYTVTDDTTGNVFTAGTAGYLHEYIDLVAALGENVTSVTISFDNGKVRLSEIYVFSHGQVPDFVQQWQPPLDGGADILLFSTHSDDDQLYFAGLFPLYARERGYRVQVAYMTDHREDTFVRSHEVLNGLWATGATNSPVFGTFPDFRIDDKDLTYAEFLRRGVTEEMMLGYVVEQIRRFDPLVVLGHDFNGEYGHGMHMVYAELVARALDITADPDQFPLSAEKYGTWDVSKAYFHAYAENPIVLDYDTPLASFDGLTAFQVSQQLGFPCHESQQIYRTLTAWIYGADRSITKASEILEYPPHKFGLLRTTVGPDVEKNDFMENIISYGEQARLEAERIEQERLEAERLEQERLEAERLEKERLEAERLEKERLEAERIEQERLEAERKAQEAIAKANARKLKLFLVLGGMILCAVALVVVLLSSSKNKRGKYAKKR